VILDRIGTDSRTFLPQTVPAHAAAGTFRYLQAQYPGYQYKEPALSPTNLLDEPTPWEKTVIQLFQAHPDQRTDTGDVPDADEPRLYVARPLTAKQPCLRCHNTPDSAPAAMTAKYGRSYGFNWKVNDVIAAQIVIVPKRVQSDEARKDFELLSSYLAIMFVIIVGIVELCVAVCGHTPDQSAVVQD